MGLDRCSGIVIEWNEVSATGIIKDDATDELVYFSFANYALARYSTDDYQFTPCIGEAVDYVLMYYEQPTAIGITNKKYWAYWHYVNKANLEAERSRKRFIGSVVINIILIVVVILLVWLLKVLIFP